MLVVASLTTIASTVSISGGSAAAQVTVTPLSSSSSRANASSSSSDADCIPMIKELHATRTIKDPARPKLIESRRALVAGWKGVAERLDAQGEIELAGDVRYFVNHLPPRRTDKEELAVRYVDHLRSKDE